MSHIESVSAPCGGSFRELKVWQMAMDLAMDVYRESVRFPASERFALTDEVRRTSRLVPSNVAEAWRRRQYPSAYAVKLNEAEGEAAETQSHLELCRRCGFLTEATARKLDEGYEEVLLLLADMGRAPVKRARPRGKGAKGD